MILKNTDDKQNLNKFQLFGYKAEKQMSFYLKRAFQDIDNILVLNDIRITIGNDAAQIDHLIVHDFGFIIIESKSVTTKVSINKNNEWSRVIGNKAKGMASPIKQAKRQLDFIKKFLNKNALELLDAEKGLLFFKTFDSFSANVLVAISDEGIISRSNNATALEAHKADQISDEVLKIISIKEKENSKVLTMKYNYKLKKMTKQNIAKFLLNSHTPLQKKTYPSKELVKKLCNKCKSENIQIMFGFNYYFKCLDCEANIPIKLKCKNESCNPKIRKLKNIFYQDCSLCKTKDIFFINSKQ